ncbi:MAG TPA: TetR/AcrR family transcriptional regulator [Xanthobacteraceae bacterium]|nr:TetR/AcrR family transcriptional regulator [Xanthobacteraceae bacterium]
MANSSESVPPPAAGTEREKIIAAFMELLGERRFEELDFPTVAERAGVPLDRCRAEFDSLFSVLAAQIEDTDRKVLAGRDADMAEEPARERLFDVLMRRLEILAPHKPAIRSLARSVRCNPALALALNALTVRSQTWMLDAAGISTAGLKGAVRAQGMACLYANVLRVWVEDDDPGLARTMAALDRQLARGAWWAGRLDDLCMLVPGGGGRGRWRPRQERRRDEPGQQPAVV